MKKLGKTFTLDGRRFGMTVRHGNVEITRYPFGHGGYAPEGWERDSQTFR